MYEMPGLRTPYAMFSGLGVFKSIDTPSDLTPGGIYRVASTTPANLRKNPFIPAEEYLIGGPDNVVAKLDPGTEVELLATVPGTLGPQTRPAYATTVEYGDSKGTQRTWVAVRTPDGKVGYIVAANLVPSEAAASSQSRSSSAASSGMTYDKTLYVGTDALNVRASPNSASASVAKLTKGAAVFASASAVSGGTYTAGGKTRGDWRPVQIGSGVSAKQGYVAEAFLVSTQPKPASGVKPPADPAKTVEAPATAIVPDESAAPEPTFFERNRMAILVGGGLLVVAGIGTIAYAMFSSKKDSDAMVFAPTEPMMAGLRRSSRRRRR